MLHRRLRKVRYDRAVLDFEHIPELFARTRQDPDTIKNLWRDKKVAGIVRGREEYPEINIIHKARDIFDIYKDMLTHDGFGQPYNLSIDDDSDYFKVTIEDVAFHSFYSTWPMFMVWNRFIPGRANRMKIRVVIDNWEASEARQRGGRIDMREDTVFVDVYTEEYPRVIKADFKDMLPGKTYTIKSLIRDLPEGIKLAPFYEKRMFEPLFIVQKTLKSHMYWQYLKGNFDASKYADIELTLMHLHEPKEIKTATPLTEGVTISKQEDERIKKLAVMLGKDFETLKKEIIASRTQKIQTEAAKVKKTVKK